MRPSSAGFIPQPFRLVAMNHVIAYLTIEFRGKRGTKAKNGVSFPSDHNTEEDCDNFEDTWTVRVVIPV
jgi:hypothetical protein